MTSTRPASRRSRRSVRTVAAVVLLLSAVVAGAAAIVVATVLALAVAVVYVVTAGSVAARLLSNETAQVRRDWARDRALAAHDQSREAVKRKREQVTFADTMAERVRDRDAQINELAASLATAEQALVGAQHQHAVTQARADALDSELDDARSALETSRAEVRRLRDELSITRAAEEGARAELLTWQSSEESRRLA